MRKSSSYYESLKQLNAKFKSAGKPPVNLVLADELLEDEDLLEMMHAELIPMIVIDSTRLAEAVAQEFEEELKPENSWQVMLDDKGNLFWKAGDTIIRREPARSFWQRFQSWFFGLFDLDDQL